MPRPSLKEERSKEILNAFIDCIAEYGLQGATQERIAKEAGVKRSILRHYLGNKDEMIVALINHVVSEYVELTDSLKNTLSKSSDKDLLFETLFSSDSSVDPRLTLAWQALVTAYKDNPRARKALLDSIEYFIECISSFLGRIYPKADKDTLEAITHGIVNIYLSHDALSPLSPQASWGKASKMAAEILIKELE